MRLQISHRILFYISSILLEIIVSFAFISLYPLLYHTFFPNLPEAEVQVYLFATFLTVFLISLWYWISKSTVINDLLTQIPILQINLFIVNTFMFIFIIIFPIIFARLIFFRSQFQENLANMSFGGVTRQFNFFFYYPLLAVSLLYFYLTYHHPQLFAKIKNAPLIIILFYIFSSLGIIILTFHVGYLSIYDISSYAGPINDVINGKPLLTFNSLYGFLSIGFLSAIFKFIPLSLLNFTILTGILVSLGFLGIFFLTTLLYKHRTFALLVTIYAIFISWITQNGLRNTLPQTTVLRFGIWIPLTIIIFLGRQTRNKTHRLLYYLLEQLIIIIGFFWSFDAGLYVLLAYFMFLWFTSLSSSIKTSLKSLIPQLCITAGMIITSFLIINLIYFIFIGIVPNWKYFTGTSLNYLSSFWLIPMPKSIFPWLILAPSWLVISYILSKKNGDKHHPDPKLSALTFIACYAVLQFTYMMGRSSLNSLHVVALPFILCFFYLIENMIIYAQQKGANVLFITILSCSLILSYSMYFTLGQGIINLKNENILTTLNSLRHPRGTEAELFQSTVTPLYHKYGEVMKNEGIAIVSIFDTWYLVLLHGTNRIGSNNLFDYFTPEAVTPLTKTIMQQRFPLLFVDHDKIQHFGQVSWIFNKVSENYVYKETIGLLDVYELRSQ